MTPLDHPAIVRFTSGERTVGGGCLLPGPVILTCSHVVNAALGLDETSQEAPQAIVHATLPLIAGEPELKARVVAWIPLDAAHRGDLALLEVRNALPAGIAPLRLVDRSPPLEENLNAYGFPAGHPAGVWSPSLNRAGPASGGWEQVGGGALKGYRLDLGFSGCPLLDSGGDALGIVAATERAVSVDAAEYIPASTIVARLSSIPDAPVPALQIPWLLEPLAQKFASALETPEGERPTVPLDLKVKIGEELLDPPDLLPRSRIAKRIVLYGPAGSGKTELLKTLGRGLIDSRLVPIFVSLKSLNAGLLDDLVSSETDAARGLENLLKAAELSPEDVDVLKKQEHLFLLIDAMNEVGLEAARHALVRAIEGLVWSDGQKVSAIVTDRTPATFTGSNVRFEWTFAEVQPLSLAQVATAIGSAAFGKLSSKESELLRTCYFLDSALKSGQTTIRGTKAATIKAFFVERLRLDADAMAKLGTAAYMAYLNDRSPSFNREHFEGIVGPELFARLIQGGVLREVGDNQAQFDHQLKHDYLAAVDLARLGAEAWTPAAFDAVSFESTSFDPLPMALEQLRDSSSADEFLRRVYDWNWPAALFCLGEASYAEEKNFSVELETALLYMVKDKLRDPVRYTRTKARVAVRSLPGPKRLLATFFPILYRPRRDLAEMRSSLPWFKAWRELYLKVPTAGSKLSEMDVATVASPDSILGWTAANVLRRFRLSAAEGRQLRQMYRSSEKDDPIDATVRWRVVHALGTTPTAENVELLIEALDDGRYLWARYGAARSLVESAARTRDAELRRKALSALRARAATLPRKVLEEVGRAAFYRGAPPSWRSAIMPVLHEARAAQSDELGREWWDQLIEDFDQVDPPASSTGPE